MQSAEVSTRVFVLHFGSLEKSTIGIVTLEDIIETILGYEIVDETDMVDDMQLLAKKISSNAGNEI